MQSWGVQSRYKDRDTGLEPSKSGVMGLLCAALGRSRDADIRDVAELKMGVRVDSPGTLLKDYHTALNVREADAKRVNLEKGTGLRTSVSNRRYLSDARFLVGLEGDDLDALTRLHDALRDPHWPLYLGRKAFVPGEPVWLSDGLRPDESLLDALRAYPWQGRLKPDQRPPRLRLVIEDDAGSEARPDQPISFAERRFAPRQVRTDWLTMEESPCTSPA